MDMFEQLGQPHIALGHPRAILIRAGLVSYQFKTYQYITCLKHV